VAGAILDAVRALCELGVNSTALARRRRGVDRGREDRMRITHGVAGSLDETAFDAEGESLVGKVGSVASGRQAQKLSLRGRGQAADAREDGVGKSLRNAHGVVGCDIVARTGDALAHDLECIERMPGCEIRDSLDVVTAEDPLPGPDREFSNRLVGERSHRELREPRIEIEAEAAGQESRDADIEPS
jgi:hypothetical protein